MKRKEESSQALETSLLPTFFIHSTDMEQKEEEKYFQGQKQDRLCFMEF